MAVTQKDGRDRIDGTNDGSRPAPATPLSHFLGLETGGFASPPRSGFAKKHRISFRLDSNGLVFNGNASLQRDIRNAHRRLRYKFRTLIQRNVTPVLGTHTTPYQAHGHNPFYSQRRLPASKMRSIGKLRSPSQRDAL